VVVKRHCHLGKKKSFKTCKALSQKLLLLFLHCIAKLPQPGALQQFRCIFRQGKEKQIQLPHSFVLTLALGHFGT
jgi:hypothetical protein